MIFACGQFLSCNRNSQPVVKPRPLDLVLSVAASSSVTYSDTQKHKQQCTLPASLSDTFLQRKDVVKLPRAGLAAMASLVSTESLRGYLNFLL